MAYNYSVLDRRNKRWMASDNSVATLHKIELRKGRLRSLSEFDIEFNYPISAIAGENGSGKSTLLAIASCAFHNNRNGYKPLNRKNNYYTFSDFFIQASEEIPPQGIRIRYQIRHDRWRRLESGLGWQTRKKREGGKWTDYATRVPRNVVYFGVQRVVPHFERSTHKSYRRYFRPGQLDAALRTRIQEIAGRIIGRVYTEFDVHEHSKYSLPVTKYNQVRYSGFNMGAGESAIFDILTSLFVAGRGTLLVIDEIELGLHEKAQRRFIRELKDLCNELHCQVICSTHSHTILDELPPEGRFFIENEGDQTRITPAISSGLACGKLSGRNAGELCLFVEDGAAEAILNVGLPYAIRRRVNIYPIGSSEAVLRQLTSRYLEQRDACLAILDGDKRNNHISATNKIAKYSEASTDDEKEQARDWGDSKIAYLPSDIWPERWLIESSQSQDDKTYLVHHWDVENVAQIDQALEEALLAGKHREFYQLSEVILQSEEQVRADVVRFVIRAEENPLEEVTRKIVEILDGDI